MFHLVLQSGHPIALTGPCFDRGDGFQYGEEWNELSLLKWLSGARFRWFVAGVLAGENEGVGKCIEVNFVRCVYSWREVDLIHDGECGVLFYPLYGVFV